MKLPPLKGVLIHIIYWTLVAILTVISTAIGIIYIVASIDFDFVAHVSLTQNPYILITASYLENFHFSNLLAASEAGC